MRKLMPLLLCAVIVVCSSVVFIGCGSIIPEELLGTYYGYKPKDGSYRLDENTYIKFDEDFKCDYSFPFLAASGVVSSHEDCVGKGYYTCDHNGDVNVTTSWRSIKMKPLVSDVFLFDDIYFCKDGVVPYEVIDGVKYAPYSSDLSAVLGGEQKDITIKSSYNGLPVTIVDSAFYNNSVTENITIDAAHEIGRYSFGRNENLKSVTLKNIGEIKSFAFAFCSKLKDVKLDGLNSIGESMFAECSSLETIEVPASVTSIGYTAFMGCTSLSSIKLPNSIAFLHNQIFDGCEALETIEYDGTVEEWKAIEKEDNWAENCHAFVKCLDGDVRL